MILLPSAPLRLLARRRTFGAVRRQLKRAKTPAGAVFALVGVAMFATWFLSVILSIAMGQSQADPESFREILRVGMGLWALLALLSSLSHRGLFIPPDEIEPLLSAPVSRADLVRYRLLSGTLRSLIAVLFLGLVAALHAPFAPFAFVGVALAVPASAAAGQLMAILSGVLEARLAKRLSRGTWILLAVAVAACATVAVLGLSGGGESEGMSDVALQRLRGLPSHPAVLLLLLPIEPFVRAVSATSAAEFLPWAGLCVLLWVALVELAARLPVDFRELSLETSANIAQRIRGLRSKGVGVSASRISRGTAGWRVPWLFGRGPAGALAWRKLVSIVRRARSTIAVAGVVLVLLTAVSTQLGARGETSDAITGNAFLVLLGVVYLATGMRFDFREDLDRMEMVKTWPVAPWRLFLSTLLPEVVLIALLLGVAVAVRAALVGAPPAVVAPLVLGLPLVVLAWVAIDNLVFLLMPVRLVPGQEGALQNMGRMWVLSLVRILVMAASAALVAAVGGGAWALAAKVLHVDPTWALAAACTGGLVAMAVCDAALVALGGRALARFDVARDRA